ncbi:MAG: DNA primase [Firmicutes bacterium]|nr:DNA primase [Bacillota bacterium]
MQLISEDKINDIRNSADIVSIVSDYIPLKMQGKNYFGVCPFHDDHSPSMSVSKERQLFKCFVCNKGGNVFTFVKDYENISYIEAVKKVADKVGIPLDYVPSTKSDSKYKLEYEIMDFTTKILQNNLNSKEGITAKEYLEKRNITDEIIRDFKMGYALNNNTYLYNVLTKKGYDINKLDDLGLITKDGIGGYDKFVNRIMIPICNLEGSVVGYTGRIFNNEDSAKYINTKETSIYKKGNILFNYHNAKNYIREARCAILVEGNMDAIRMYSSGVRNVLALMGTAMTKEQVEILKKLRVPIILMLDNDNAGELATVNIGNELIKNNVDTKVVRLSGAKDPDEYIVKYGVNAFNDIIKHSLNYFDYKLHYLKENKNLNNTEELINYVKSVLKMLDGADNLTKEITIKKLSEEHNLDYEILKQELTFDKIKEIKPVIPINSIGKDRYDKCVTKVLYYMMSDSKYLKIFNTKLGFLKNPEERNLIREIEYYIEKYGKINLADFISYGELDDNIRDLVNTISGSVNFEELEEKTFIEYLNAIKDILNREEIKKLKESLKKETDINKQVEISKKILDLKKGSVKNGRN